MNDKEILIKVVFNPIKNKFELQVGAQYIELNNIQFAKMMEYLNLVWKSFVDNQKAQ